MFATTPSAGAADRLSNATANYFEFELSRHSDARVPAFSPLSPPLLRAAANFSSLFLVATSLTIPLGCYSIQK
jgi:hypothetical protein